MNPSDLPRFAVIGRVNKGKSSILATLVEEADNRRIRISATPGETTRCQSIPLVLHGETLVEFIDTPGFNQARKALDWMNRRHRKRPGEARIETVRDFVETYRNKRDFEDECLLLEPILEGAGILYVVDTSKPFRPDFLAEMEILRWTGRPRMALLNHISAETDFTPEWRQHLGESFNLTREFNAHTARFSERIRLLSSLLEIEDEPHPNLEKTIRILNREWERRRNEATDIIIDTLQSCLTHRATRTMSREVYERDYRKAEIESELVETYLKELREKEAEGHRKLARLYRHGDVEFGPDDQLEAMAGDLFSEEVWQVLGLDKRQLLLAGGVAGAASGGALDLATGGHTAGLGALIGGLVGVAATVLKGRDLAEIKVATPVAGEVAAGGIALKAGPPRNANFPWVILDRALFHFEKLVTRAHGRRDTFVVDFAELAAEGKRVGRSSRLEAPERRVLQRWFQQLTSGRKQAETGVVFSIIRGMTDAIEAGVEPSGPEGG